MSYIIINLERYLLYHSLLITNISFGITRQNHLKCI